MLVGGAKPRPAKPSNRVRVQPAPFTVVDLGDSTRVAAMLTPQSRGSFREQLTEILASLNHILRVQGRSLKATTLSVFLRSGDDQSVSEQMLQHCFGAELPVTNYMRQAPADGAAVALEVWAIGGDDVRVERPGPESLVLSYDSARWIYCAGLRVEASRDVYQATRTALTRMGLALREAGADFQDVLRTWLYLGNITGLDNGVQRYKELNRARTDFYHDIRFGARLDQKIQPATYPASTGIGMAGDDLRLSCVALQSRRADIVLRPLENPRQTPAYAYQEVYSPKSPKFSRAMALRLGEYVTTWVSGTASIVRSESCHEGDIEKQTLQTIDNIANLVNSKNLAEHGLPGVHAGLEDLAKVRVYLKRPEDYTACRAVCEKHFGSVPAVYTIADVCRPELLVEIEGIAFSKCARKL